MSPSSLFSLLIVILLSPLSLLPTSSAACVQCDVSSYCGNGYQAWVPAASCTSINSGLAQLPFVAKDAGCKSTIYKTYCAYIAAQSAVNQPTDCTPPAGRFCV